MALVNLQRRRPRRARPLVGNAAIVGGISTVHWSWRYIAAGAAPLLSAAAFVSAPSVFAHTNFLVYVPSVFLAGLYGGLWPGLVATAVSIALAQSIRDVPASSITVAIFAVVGVITSVVQQVLHDAIYNLREGEWRLRFLIENLREYAIFIIGADGRIASWNVGAERIEGYKAHEIVGKSYETFFTPEDRQAGRPAAALARARENGVHSEEGWRVRKDGSRFWAGVSLTALRDDKGLLFGFAKVTRDLTERRAREEELRRTIAELASFSYTVSHDLRAPLRAIEGFSEVLLGRERRRMAPESVQLLERIAVAATRMDRLIQDLLFYSRISREELATAEVDLDAIIDHVVGHYAGLKDAPIEIRRPLGRACGQESLVTQIVSNLLMNAVKFTPKAGARVQVRVERAPTAVRLVVEDNGPGIPADAVNRIFEPFTRLGSTLHVEGTGIGLAIVRRAAERMGGRAGVDSSPGKGSRFWVELRPC